MYHFISCITFGRALCCATLNLVSLRSRAQKEKRERERKKPSPIRINIYASRNINAFDFLFAISLIKCAKKPKTRIYAITNCKCVWHSVEWIGGPRPYQRAQIGISIIGIGTAQWKKQAEQEKWAFNKYIEKQEMNADVFLRMHASYLKRSSIKATVRADVWRGKL